MGGVRDLARDTTEMLERKTLCLSGEPGSTIHDGDKGFAEGMRSNFNAAESDAVERLVLLKQRLRKLPEKDFWPVLTKELAGILGAQYTLVSKRVLPEHGNAVAEIPELGAPGTCFSNLAFHFSGEDDKPERVADGFEYPVGGSLCAHMKHDKVFLVPGHLADFIRDRAADFEVPVESHFAIPLMDEDRCFAHIGTFWSVKGEKARKLSWAMIEMMLHAVEDICVWRLLGQRRVRRQNSIQKPSRTSNSETMIASSLQSLKPYARSMSHELRTPMHGVVGMLDIMHVTVQDALEAHGQDVALTGFLRALRENIETIQDSARRAVEAADNIVHAYDFDMQVPGPTATTIEVTAAVAEASVEPLDEETATHETPTGQKRKRSASPDLVQPAHSPKQRILSGTPKPASPHMAALRSIVKESSDITNINHPADIETIQADVSGPAPSTPGTKLTRVREIIQVVVNESLRFGGRPDSAIATETVLGEQIEVRNVASNGETSVKQVEWSVDPSVPDELVIDERDFAKLVSVLFLNALKFTDEGSVKLRATLSPKTKYVVVKVTDTGTGIPPAFRPYLFKAFSRGDESLTRQNEGLGLGLMVAKGLSRRVGGDLVCVRSDIEGPNRGSEFELRIPLTPRSGSSRSSTPSRTPTPVTRGRSETPAITAEPEVAPLQQDHVFDPAHTITSSLPSPPMPQLSSPSHRPLLGRQSTPRRRSQTTTGMQAPGPNRELAKRFPLNLMVAEDNRINRKLLVNMLHKLGYTQVHEAFDGSEAVRLMEMDSKKPTERHIDLILMDLWMPNMDGYEAAQRILKMQRARNGNVSRPVKILAVTADVTDVALDRAREVGMQGIMTKPYKMVDLERLIVEYCPQKVAA